MTWKVWNPQNSPFNHNMKLGFFKLLHPEKKVWFQTIVSRISCFTEQTTLLFCYRPLLPVLDQCKVCIPPSINLNSFTKNCIQITSELWRGGSVGRALDSRSKGPRLEPCLRQEHKKILCEIFQIKNVVLTRCRCAQPPMCIRTHKNDHVRTLKIL